MELKASRRKWISMFLVTLFLGYFGLHRFYAGRNKTATIMFIFSIVVIIAGALLATNWKAQVEFVDQGPFVWTYFAITCAFGACNGIWWLVDVITVCLQKFRDREGRFISDLMSENK